MRDAAIAMSCYSSSTIISLYGHYFQIVTSGLWPEDIRVGGEDAVFEIDEPKFCKKNPITDIIYMVFWPLFVLKR